MYSIRCKSYHCLGCASVLYADQVTLPSSSVRPCCACTACLRYTLHTIFNLIGLSLQLSSILFDPGHMASFSLNLSPLKAAGLWPLGCSNVPLFVSDWKVSLAQVLCMRFLVLTVWWSLEVRFWSSDSLGVLPGCCPPLGLVCFGMIAVQGTGPLHLWRSFLEVYGQILRPILPFH